jgi:hypothetical protein
MSRLSYLRALTNAPVRGTPALRPGRPPRWGSSTVPVYETVDHDTVDHDIALNHVLPDSNPEVGDSALTVNSSRREYAVREPEISIQRARPSSTKVELSPDFSTSLAEDPHPARHGQNPVRALHQNKTPSAVPESTVVANAEIEREVLLPREKPDRHSSGVLERARKGAIDFDWKYPNQRALDPTDSQSSPAPSSLTPGTPLRAMAKAEPAKTNAPPPVEERQVRSAETFREVSIPREPVPLVPVVEQMAAPPRRVDAQKTTNTVHIGTVDIHIIPPAAPAVQSAARQSSAAVRGVMSRGFTSSFGLRQA